MEERRAKLTILLGTNGTGKTTMLHNILVQSGQKALIIMTDEIEWTEYPLNDLKKPEDFSFTGIQRHVFDSNKTLNALELFTKGILVFDDCRAFLKSTTAEKLRKLLIRRRQQEIDIFAVGHGFTQVPPEFFTFASDYILFKTCDNIRRRKDCIVNYDFMASCQQYVNEQAKKDLHFFRHIQV